MPSSMSLQLFFPLLYITIAYFLTEQPHEFFRFAIVAAFAMLISVVAQSIGLLIGAACSIQVKQAQVEDKVVAMTNRLLNQLYDF